MARDRLLAIGLVPASPDATASESDPARIKAINDRHFGAGAPLPSKPEDRREPSKPGGWRRKRRSLYIWLPMGISAEMKRQAEMDGLSVSAFVRRVLRNTLNV